jgi:hypothetical protein
MDEPSWLNDCWSADLIIHQTGLGPTRSVRSRPRSNQECANAAHNLRLWCAPRGIRTPNRQIRRLVLYVQP